MYIRVLDLCICSVCLMCISMTFEPTHLLLLIDVARAFETPSHMQWSVKGWQNVCWKSLRMWPRFRTAQNMRIWSFRKMAMHCLCFLRTSQDCDCIYALCLCFHFCASLLALSSSLTSQFCQFDIATMRLLLLALLQRMINLRKHTQLEDILLAFLAGWMFVHKPHL